MASSAEQYHHPLPTPPQQAQRPAHYRKPSGAETKHRSFSINSDRSHKSSGSKGFNNPESHDEKEAHRLHSKADPTLAMNEAEPSTVAAMRGEQFHMPLRSIQHKDTLGNLIADPDLSNPTRNRWERPLDTIRSFEAAIDGGYNRKSMIRADTDPVANWNRRNSYHPSQPRFPQDSYYGGRPMSYRPDQSQYGPSNAGTARNSYYGGPGAYNGVHENGYGQPVPRQRGSRMQTDPHYQLYGRETNVYPMPNKDRSYETVTSAAASGNSDPAGYQTDPTSSDNSSIDRQSPAKRQEPVNDYGIGFSQPQAYHAPNFALGNNRHPLPPPPMDAGGPGARQGVPRKQPALQKRMPVQARPAEPEKRKSWFSRRFSKNA